MPKLFTIHSKIAVEGKYILKDSRLAILIVLKKRKLNRSLQITNYETMGQFTLMECFKSPERILQNVPNGNRYCGTMIN